jgi:peroxiredoxin Q/BCP
MSNKSISVGDRCPTFSLLDQHSETINSSDLIGKQILVIYFYPKDDTPACTKEACSFRDSHADFADLGCKVIGISSDSAATHLKFAEKYRLNFTLLADEKGAVRKSFGVPRALFGILPGRVTYIIDKKGAVRGVFNSMTDPLGHIEHALETVRAIQSTE